MEFLSLGAEASIYRDEDRVIKIRIKKGYRHPLLDNRLRLMRTRREARLLQRAREVVPVPRVFSVDEKSFKIEMEYIEGEKLRDYLLKTLDPKPMKEVGRLVAALHSYNIVHGDLTTSNFIISNDKIYIIDFGLGEITTSIESKAVDIVCFKKSYFATHPDLPEGWNLFLNNYRWKRADDVLKRVEEVERRARYL